MLNCDAHKHRVACLPGCDDCLLVLGDFALSQGLPPFFCYTGETDGESTFSIYWKTPHRYADIEWTPDGEVLAVVGAPFHKSHSWHVFNLEDAIRKIAEFWTSENPTKIPSVG